MPNFKIHSFGKKKNSVMDLLASAQGTHRTNQSVRWSCKPIILSIGQFEGQLKSN